MKYKIRLIPQSAFLIGGNKLKDNYNRSLDYIPGGVLRAALSKEITLACPYYEEKAGKRYWVEFKDKQECEECIYRELCYNFSEIVIENSYALNSKIYPLTARRCKEHMEHQVLDILVDQICMKIYRQEKTYNYHFSTMSCPNCNGRIERCDGRYIVSNGVVEDVELVYMLTTRNTINPYMRTTTDGALYSLDAVGTVVMVNGREQENYLEGIIVGNDIESAINSIDEVFVGAYITEGFGKMKMQVVGKVEDETVEDIRYRIGKFNQFINHEENLYIPITLCSDAYLDIENYYEEMLSEKTTQEYIEMYNHQVKEFADIGKIFLMMLSCDTRRGYNTAKDRQSIRQAKKIIKAGSIFVLEVRKEYINYNKLLEIQLKGIGNNKVHGFGKVSVCDAFHVDYYQGGCR